MKPKPEGAIHPTLAVKDESGNEYACPQSAVRNVNVLAEDEKQYCERMQASR